MELQEACIEMDYVHLRAFPLISFILEGVFANIQFYYTDWGKFQQIPKLYDAADYQESKCVMFSLQLNKYSDSMKWQLIGHRYICT